MQPYVQKSTRTTFPRKSAMLSGPELSQLLMPTKFGAGLPASANFTSSSPLTLSALCPNDVKPNMQAIRDAGDTPDTGGDELATIGDCQHGHGGTDGVNDEQQRFPFDVGSSCD